MAQREVLDSWKAIADYLKRDIRTCRRYARELGLPIHRLEATAEAQSRNPGGDSNFLFLRAEMLIKKKAFEEARAACSAITSILEKQENKKLMRDPLYLEGKIESELGNHGKAIVLLSRAKSLLPPGQGTSTQGEHALFVDSLALAYFRARDLEMTRQEYESIGRMTFGRYEYGDIYAKSFYRLGQIYEKMGQKKQARANYRKRAERGEYERERFEARIWNECGRGARLAL